jgi:WD40 repeat protein/tRNA A-37 threonylcarbamoyl transferase component Bud32
MSVPRRPDPGDPSQPLDRGPTADLLRAWQGGQAPELEAFVAALPNLSPCELADLVWIDLDQRQRRQDPRRAEDYLARFPAVAADAELAIDVIYAEYLAREQAGERPDLGEYRRRFPAFGDVLAEQIGLHCALAAANDDTPAGTTQTGPSLGSTAEPAVNPPQLEASYEILEEIGRGGMGVVYKARQPALNRFVALKMVRAVDASNQELLARFRSEARVVASLRHPLIVQVYDFGDHDGLPYLAMELIERGTLADRLDGTPWPAHAAAKLMIDLAGAVQFAHERYVIHRDLKPANVLIVSEAPELEVKITDFGLAKLFHEGGSQHTKSGAFIGTPSYMAPEQVSGKSQQIGPPADVYALGAILYELLTGRPPFCGASPIETLQQRLAMEPISVFRLAPHAPRDLATICEKCLRTEIDRRYGSAAELRDDLERYLAGMPVQARRIGGVERAWRWCRRNPTWAVALGSVAMLLLGIAAMSLWYSGRLRGELVKTQLAEHSERVANRESQGRLWDSYLIEVNARNVSRRVGQRVAALETVDKAQALLGTIGRTEARVRQLRGAVLSSMALPDLRMVWKSRAWPANNYVCAMSPAADLFVVFVNERALTGYRLSDRSELWSIDYTGKGIQVVTSGDGRFVAALGDRGAAVWRVDGPQPKLAWQVDGVNFLNFSSDALYAAYSHPAAGMQLVEGATGRIVRKLGEGSALSQFHFRPAGGRVAVCAPNLQVFSCDTGNLEFECPSPHTAEPRLAWHPDGEHIAVWGDTEEIALWNLKVGKPLFVLPHMGMPAQLVCSADGSLLLSYSLWDRRLLVWDMALGQRLLEVPAFKIRVAAATPEGTILVLGDSEGQQTLTEVSRGICRPLSEVFDKPLAYWFKLSVSPDGRMLAASSQRGVELWDLKTTRRLAVWPGGVCSADFVRGGHLMVGCKLGVYRWPCHLERPTAVSAAESDHRTVIRFGPPEKLTGPIVPTSLSISASAESMIFEDSTGWAVLHTADKAAAVRLQTTGDPRKSAVSNDNRFAAIANWDNIGASVWDAGSGTLLATLPLGFCGVLQFSPDGRLLAATPDGVTLWRTSDWQRVSELHAAGTTPTGLGLAFSPDSRVLAVGQPNGILRLVDPVSGQDWVCVTQADLNITSILAFTPDQRHLVTSSIDERLPGQIWDLTAMRRELARRGIELPAEVLSPAATVSAIDGEVEVVLDDGGLLRQLDAGTK